MVSKLKMLRVCRDLSQVKLAQITGLSQPKISRLENCLLSPSDKETALLEKALDVKNLNQGLAKLLEEGGGDEK